MCVCVFSRSDIKSQKARKRKRIQQCLPAFDVYCYFSSCSGFIRCFFFLNQCVISQKVNLLSVISHPSLDLILQINSLIFLCVNSSDGTSCMIMLRMHRVICSLCNTVIPQSCFGVCCLLLQSSNHGDELVMSVFVLGITALTAGPDILCVDQSNSW